MLEVTKRKEYRGRHAGLSAVKIAKLAGCSVTHVKKLLYRLPPPITEDQIGELIYQIRSKKHLTNLSRFLNP